MAAKTDEAVGFVDRGNRNLEKLGQVGHDRVFDPSSRWFDVTDYEERRTDSDWGI